MHVADVYFKKIEVQCFEEKVNFDFSKIRLGQPAHGAPLMTYLYCILHGLCQFLRTAVRCAPGEHGDGAPCAAE